MTGSDMHEHSCHPADDVESTFHMSTLILTCEDVPNTVVKTDEVSVFSESGEAMTRYETVAAIRNAETEEDDVIYRQVHDDIGEAHRAHVEIAMLLSLRKLPTTGDRA